MARLITAPVWNESMKTNDASLARQLELQPEKLTSALTYLMGSKEDSFPLHYLSEGMGAKMEIVGDEYTYDIVGRLYKPMMLAATVTTVNAGIGYSEFNMTFNEGIFPVKYTIFTPRNYQLVITNRKNVGSQWVYTVKMANANSNTSSVPASELVAGTMFTLGWYGAASSGSTGSESTTVGTSKIRGDVSTIRKSYAWEGNVKHRRAMGIQLPSTNGGTQDLWWPFEEWQHQVSFKRECESNFWYSKSNRDANGQVSERDEEGNIVYRGDGLLEQIANKSTYSELTAAKLTNTIRNVFFNMNDADEKQITLFTGTGGMAAFDTAMKNELMGSSYIKLTDNKFVTGSGRKLALGGYFTTYYHPDGYTINVVKNRLYDEGPLSKGLMHPKHNLPLESFRMTFVDTSTYGGESNLMMVTKKGRAMVRGILKGMNEAGTGFTGNSDIQSDKDASSLHLMKTGQVVLRRFNTSIDLQCVAGL